MFYDVVYYINKDNKIIGVHESKRWGNIPDKKENTPMFWSKRYARNYLAKEMMKK